MALPLKPETLGAITTARLTLGREVAGLSTRSMQQFRVDHAAAREAVWRPLDTQALARRLGELGLGSRQVDSAAQDRAEYLRRPDLGRRLSAAARAALANAAGGADVALVIGDGLSAFAVERHAVPLVAALGERLAQAGLTLAAPLTVATHARVALGDEIGALLGARAVVVLIGERPGLSSPDSLGLYLTFAPEVGLPDSRRNCISNVHDNGLSPVEAAERACALLRQMFLFETSGVALADAGAEPALKLEEQPED